MKAHLHARGPHRGLDLTAVCHCNQLEWANAYVQWCLALWRHVLFKNESQFLLYGADGIYAILWVSSLLTSMLWIEWPIVTVGLYYGQAYVMDKEYRCIILMAF